MDNKTLNNLINKTTDIEKQIKIGIFYLIINSKHSDNYFRSDYRIFSQLLCLGINVNNKHYKYIQKYKAHVFRMRDSDYFLYRRYEKVYYTKSK